MQTFNGNISSKTYIECSKCLLSSRDTECFFLDAEGVCNYCNYYSAKVKELGSLEDRTVFLKNKIEEIKSAGKSQEYDCILGLSGGSDSSYMAIIAHEFGLRPLIVHLDNGWNSSIAVRNIERICEKFNFELFTHVIVWEEFMALQRAYLKAGVIDIEVLTDHAIYAVLNELAERFNIKYILSGFNYATEAIMPQGWVYNKRDFSNIKDIVKKYGDGVKFKSYPYISFLKSLYNYWFLKLETFAVLNYIDYDKEKAKLELKEKVGWTDYGGKHFESVFTKFYQSYILPQKFGVDKRRAHLSNQICTGTISKEFAQNALKDPLYSDLELEEEKAYVLKKLNWTNEEFDKIMNSKPRSHSEFKTDQRLWNRYFKLVKLLKFGR